MAVCLCTTDRGPAMHLAWPPIGQPNQGVTHFVGDDCPGGHAKEAERGFKFDEGKLRYDLIPPFPLAQLARVYTRGAKKYGDANYMKGMAWGRVIAALMRHVEAFRAGESIDPESGLPHLAHAAWQCFTLMVYELYDLGEDNRPAEFTLSGLEPYITSEEEE